MSFSVQSSNVAQSTLQAVSSVDVMRTQPQTTPPIPSGSYQLEPGYHPQLGALFAAGGNAANAASFDSQVRGQDAKAIDLELILRIGVVAEKQFGHVASFGGAMRAGAASSITLKTIRS